VAFAQVLLLLRFFFFHSDVSSVSLSQLQLMPNKLGIHYIVREAYLAWHYRQ
jgi:hypothetical protein